MTFVTKAVCIVSEVQIIPYQVVTQVKRKSWRAMMGAGWDHREVIFLSLGLIVS